MKTRFLYHLVMIMIVGSFLFSSCKGKKKLTSVTDTAQVSQQIEEEVAEESKTVETTYNKPVASTAVRLENYFTSIASAPSLASANNSIQEAQSMFNSGDAPVLIIFYAAGGKAEYDEPTTINKYLNYLKDTKQSVNRVEDFTLDSSGKIKELVLYRK